MIDLMILWILLFLGLAFLALAGAVPEANAHRVLQICATATFVVGLIISVIAIAG